MSLEVERRDYPETGTVVIRPRGRISLATVPALRRCLRGLTRDDALVVVVDLSHADLADSAVLHPLVELTRRGRAHGMMVVVAGAASTMEERMRLYGLRDRRRAPRGEGDVR